MISQKSILPGFKLCACGRNQRGFYESRENYLHHPHRYILYCAVHAARDYHWSSRQLPVQWENNLKALLFYAFQISSDRMAQILILKWVNWGFGAKKKKKSIQYFTAASFTVQAYGKKNVFCSMSAICGVVITWFANFVLFDEQWESHCLFENS